jgi:hypothetical protein
MNRLWIKNYYLQIDKMPAFKNWELFIKKDIYNKITLKKTMMSIQLYDSIKWLYVLSNIWYKQIVYLKNYLKFHTLTNYPIGT